MGQRENCGPFGIRRSSSRGVHRRPDLEAREGHRPSSDHQAKKHCFRHMVFLLAGRWLLPLDILREFTKPWLTVQSLTVFPPAAHLVSSRQRRLRHPIRSHESPPHHGPRHCSPPRWRPYHLHRLLHSFHAYLLSPRLSRHRFHHNLQTQHRRTFITHPVPNPSSYRSNPHQLTTLTLSPQHSAWIGYQALFGLGSGLGMNQPLMAAQTVLPLDDVSIGTALVIFGQTLGGAIFVSAAQNVFTNTLLTNLQHSLPEINPELVLSAGATALRKVVEGQGLGKEAVARAAEAYSGALVKAFQMATGLACVTIIGAVGMEWKSVKEEGRDVSAAMG